jgi:uncharacterized protein YndB with AHSA1/START domain
MKSELTIMRELDAPREAVWDAWTNPVSVIEWWGPKGFTAPCARIDLSVGGSYLFCSRSPEGQHYWNTGDFLEIIPQKRILSTSGFSDEVGNFVPPAQYEIDKTKPLKLSMTVTFEEIDGKTLLTLSYEGLPHGKNRDMVEEAWNQTLDKLSCVLLLDYVDKSMSSSKVESEYLEGIS